MIIFPEASLSGYCDYRYYPHAAQALDSPYIEAFAQLSAEHGITASAGFIETNPNGHQPYVTQVVAREGRVIAVYRKRYVQDDESHLFTTAKEATIFDLPLDGASVRCGLAICSDSDRPEFFAEMAVLDTRVVFHSSSPGLYGRRTDEASWRDGYEWYKGYLADQLPHYARDNHLYIAVATQAGSTADEDFPGGSFLFAPDGSCVAATPDWHEHLLTVDIDLSKANPPETDD
jgi:predicted amidohydrolase